MQRTITHRLSHSRLTVVAGIAGAFLAVTSLAASCGSNGASGGSTTLPHTTSTKAPAPSGAHALLLRVSDLPSGWQLFTGAVPASVDTSSCGGGAFTIAAAQEATVNFAFGGILPGLEEQVGIFRDATATFTTIKRLADACKTTSMTALGVHIPLTMGPLAFAQVGNESAAYAVSGSFGAKPVTGDLAIVRKGSAIAAVVYGGFAPLDPAAFKQLVDAALRRL